MRYGNIGVMYGNLVHNLKHIKRVTELLYVSIVDNDYAYDFIINMTDGQ